MAQGFCDVVVAVESEDADGGVADSLNSTVPRDDPFVAFTTSLVVRVCRVRWSPPWNLLQDNSFADNKYLCKVNHAMFPNCLCDTSFRDATYDEVYSAISNTVHVNGLRCRRACSVPSLMFHRVIVIELVDTQEGRL